MKYKAIISDIDGTFAPSGFNTFPSDKVLQAVKKLEEKNVIFTLATGRPFFLLEYLLDHLKLPMLVIFDNGAGIYDTEKKKIIWESTIDSVQADEILQLIRKDWDNEISVSLNEGRPLINPEVITEPTRKITALSFTEEQVNTLIRRIEEKYKNLAVTKSLSFKSDNLLDINITSLEATKQHAIIKLSELLGISPEETIGIGDHYNDFPLLMACGLKVAMGNAVEDLKAIADYVAPTVEEDGVVDVIEKFILQA